jgi:hypothetical protein
MKAVDYKILIYDSVSTFLTALGAFAKERKAIFIFVMSVGVSTTRRSLDGFSLNLIFEDFWKISGEISSFIKI